MDAGEDSIAVVDSTDDTIITFVNALVVSRIDYCNAVLKKTKKFFEIIFLTLFIYDICASRPRF